MRHTEEKMGRLIWKIKNQNELIRRFVEEEDAVGVVEIILILVVLIGLCHHFQRAADRTGAEHSFKDRQTE